MLETHIDEGRVKASVVTTLMPATGRQTLGDDEDLLAVLDSLQILRLAVQLERVFGIRIDNSDLTSENIGTVGRLTAFIAAKTARHARS